MTTSEELSPPLATGLGAKIGVVLGRRYLLEAVLDSGGMGAVYRAWDRERNEAVAVKVLAPHLAVHPQARGRFHREAELIGAIDHPGIVRVFDSGVEPGHGPYLVLELLEGESLAARLEREPALQFETAMTVAHQCAEALAAAHSRDVVHRDLKPSNVFLTTDESGQLRVKLLDFGISKHAMGPSGLTGQFDILGTPEYMTPEQAQGKTAAVDHRGDQYALAVVVHEMLTGDVPLTGDSVAAVLEAVRSKEPEFGASFPFPQQLARVLAKALSKEPAERHVDILEFDRELCLSAERVRELAREPRYSGVETLRQQRPVDGFAATIPAPPAPETARPRSSRSPGSERLLEAARSVLSKEAEPEPGWFVQKAREMLESGDVTRAQSYTASALAEQAGHSEPPRSRTGSRLSREQLLVLRVDDGVFARGKLTPEQAFMLSQMRGDLTLDDAISISPAPVPETLGMILDLFQAGLIRVA
jgi:serine/threonine protein kinase